jgi:hypothetical protein
MALRLVSFAGGELAAAAQTAGGGHVLSRSGEAIAVLRCSTKSFALMDGDDKAWAVQAWSRVQAGLAQRSSVARIAVQDYTVPYPSTALRDFYEHAVGRQPGQHRRTHMG